jgi:hypothetical protein
MADVLVMLFLLGLFVTSLGLIQGLDRLKEK